MSDPAPIRVAVLGVGHLGARHAERLAASGRFLLDNVYDTVLERARTRADVLGCRAAATIDDALGSVEAAVVATSTRSHGEVVSAALDAGCHVLVEKPFTGRVEQASQLAERARSASRVLHVGLVERFNPAVLALPDGIPAPLFVESHRLASLVPRNLDIDVVQDLMIHDIDLALSFLGREPESVEAVGVSVLTDRVDIANARLRFPGGAVANLTASRVSLDRTRKFRMFLPGTYVSIDCAAGRGDLYRLGPEGPEAVAGALRDGTPLDMRSVLAHEPLRDSGGRDALTGEHEAFADAIAGKPHRGVDAGAALATLRTLMRVEEAIRRGGASSP